MVCRLLSIVGTSAAVASGMWGSFRFNDAQHIMASGVSMDAAGLHLPIHQSKTTGAGKKVEILYAHVSPAAFLACPSWLQVGFDLWRTQSGPLERDYLMPLPSPDLSGCREAPISYADSLNITRAILKELRPPIPTKDGGAGLCWKVGEGLLLPSDAALFWTEHSDRSLLTSWGAALGYTQDVLNRIGRWSPQGSEEYVRSSQSIVLKAQLEIAEYVRTHRSAGDACGEAELLRQLIVHLGERGWAAGAAEETAGRLSYFCSDTIGDRRTGLPSALPAPSSPSAVSSAGEESGPASSKFVVAITRNAGVRRLHRAGWCWRKPGVDYAKFEWLSVPLDPTRYTTLCKIVGASAARPTSPRLRLVILGALLRRRPNRPRPRT